MTVITKEQANKLLASLPKPTTCAACSTPLGGDGITMPHGPFTIHVCPRCEWKIKKSQWKGRRATIQK